MNTQLKKAILEYIFENLTDFQILNKVTNNFREYIYTSSGEYLIGGQEVSEFIKNAINLIKK